MSNNEEKTNKCTQMPKTGLITYEAYYTSYTCFCAINPKTQYNKIPNRKNYPFVSLSTQYQINSWLTPFKPCCKAGSFVNNVVK